jgi:hypothetical protein
LRERKNHEDKKLGDRNEGKNRKVGSDEKYFLEELHLINKKDQNPKKSKE